MRRAHGYIGAFGGDIYLGIRRRISQWCFERSPLTGKLEADES